MPLSAQILCGTQSPTYWLYLYDICEAYPAVARSLLDAKKLSLVAGIRGVPQLHTTTKRFQLSNEAQEKQGMDIGVLPRG